MRMHAYDRSAQFFVLEAKLVVEVFDRCGHLLVLKAEFLEVLEDVCNSNL